MSAESTTAVTLVFTDLVNSTALKDQLPGADITARNRLYFDSILTPHRERVESGLKDCGGRVVKTEGDAYFAVFASAAAATQWAIEVQLSHLNHPIPTPLGPLQVKIGMHTGNPLPDGDDFIGQEVDYAARVSALAGGGQIVLSGTSASLVRDAGIGGLKLHPHGERELKGIGSVAVFEALYGGREAQPLKAAALREGFVPAPATPFIGREAQIATWCDVLRADSTRLLTLIGFGGMGKTRSALQLATLCHENFSADFPQGVWWIELEEARTGDAMISRIAASLHFQLQPQPSAREQLWSYLRERQALLVLDNLEQIPDAAVIVNEMLKAAPRLKIAATSRRALNLQIEQQIEVPPLPIDEAVLLFGQRAQSRRTAMTPGADAAKNAGANAEAEADIRELCRRLEGVPLAIELAASRSAAMTPREMTGRLSERFRLLQSRAPDLPPRQRALRGAIDWSHELLSEEDQSLFAQLGVFAGGFTLLEAEAVCDAFDVFEGVQELWSQSLLRAATGLDQTTRYLMLESLRDYAGEKLAAAPEVEATVRRRHLDYFLDFARERIARLRTAEEAAALREMEAGADNVRAAMDWAQQQQEHLLCARLALALGTWLQRRGLQQEAITRFTTGLEAVNRLPGERRSMAAELLRERGGVHLDMHEWEAARGAANESLAVFESIGDARGVSQARNLLGWVAEDEKDFSGARAHFVAALQGFEACGDRVGTANVRNNLGNLESQDATGDKAQAEHHLRAALELLRAGGDARGLAAALTNLGALAFEAGRVDEASERYREALSFQRELCDVSGIAFSLFNLGEVAELKGQQGDTQQTRLAYRLLAAAERLFDEAGSPHKSFVREFCARVAAGLGYAPTALDVLQRNLREKSLDDLLVWAVPENS